MTLRLPTVQRLLALAALGSPAGAAGFTASGRTFDHQWITRAVMPQARSDMTATTVGSGIYLIGGCSMDQVWTTHPWGNFYECGSGLPAAVSRQTALYSPANDRHFANLRDAPRARYRHAAAAVGSTIYLFGGTGADGNPVPEVDVYDTAIDSWMTLAEPMLEPATDLTAVEVGGRIFILGGYNANWEALTSVRIFDPTRNGTAAWSSGPPMNQARGDTAAAAVSGSILVVGGFHHGNNFEIPVDSLERWDAVAGGAGQWTVRKAMAVARGDKAVAALHGVVHVVGGETKNANGHSVPLSDVEVYDPASNDWYSGGSIPSSRFRFTAAAHGNSIFLFGGQGYLQGGSYGTAGSRYPVLSTVEEYLEGVANGDDNFVSGAERAGASLRVWTAMALAAASLASSA